jgi:hypothetical protein
MPFLTEALVVKSCGPSTWFLVEPVIYEGRTQRFEVPIDFKTDFASVPTLCTWLIPRYGVYTRAAVLHDFLCALSRVRAFNRRDADGLFRRCLRELGVSGLRRWLMWAAVRVDSRMAGATGKEWLQFTSIALVVVPLLALPVLIVGLWAAAFWIVERLSR